MSADKTQSIRIKRRLNKIKLLENNIKSKNSFLCLGLDTDINKIPKYFLSYDDPVFDFNKAMVDRLHHKVVAVKINTAFYEARGKEGWGIIYSRKSYIVTK